MFYDINTWSIRPSNVTLPGNKNYITYLIVNIVCVQIERLIHIEELYGTFQLVSRQQHIWSLATTVAMETYIYLHTRTHTHIHTNTHILTHTHTSDVYNPAIVMELGG